MADVDAFKDASKDSEIDKILEQNKLFKTYYKESELKADSMKVADLKKIAIAKSALRDYAASVMSMVTFVGLMVATRVVPPYQVL